MKGPWVKLWRNVFNDEKVSFVIRRYGHEAGILWIGLLAQVEDGVLFLDEDVFADLVQIKENRYRELRGVLIQRGLCIENDDGRLVLPNWEEYQVADSTERSRECRARRKAAEAAKKEAETAQNHAATMQRCGNEMQRDCNEMQRVEVEVEVDKNSHTPREKNQSPVLEAEAETEQTPEPEPIIAPGDDAYPKAVFAAWAEIGDRVYQPASYLHFANGTWGKIRPFVRGIHSDLVLQAIANFSQILTAPPGRYFWNQRIPLEAFFERHLARFLPANFRPDDFVARKGGASGPRPLPTDSAKLAKAKAAWDALPDDATTNEIQEDRRA